MVEAFSLLTFECSAPALADSAGPHAAIHVVGDHPALGCWDVAKSIPMKPGSLTGSVSRTTAPVSLPANMPVQYKYIIFDSTDLLRWEAFEGNRFIVPNHAEMLVGDELDRLAPPNVHIPRTAVSHSASLGNLAAISSGGGASPSMFGGPVRRNLSMSGSQTGGISRGASSADMTSVGASGHGQQDYASLVASAAVLVVSYILPLVIKRDMTEPSGWAIEWNQDAITAKRTKSSSKRVVWIGCPGLAVAADDQPGLIDALAAFSCVPIFLEPSLDYDFYFGFCRSYLWPIFHNVIKSKCFTQKVWRAYCTANRKFADKVIETYDSHDLIWVHDYHLLLLPSYILRKLRTARVGLSVHTAFPSSEIFRTVPVRDELLRGMLNADLIGFHVFEYARHFLTCCKRILGLEFDYHGNGGFLAVRDQKREVLVASTHMGIEPDVLQEAQLRGEDECKGWDTTAGLLRLRSEGKTVMLGIDEIERLKGLPLKLLAFEQLLRTKPERAGSTALVQIAVKARNFTPAAEADYEEVRSEVLEIISRITGDFPGSVHLVELPTICLAQRMQLWALADVTVFTPLREGYNACPLEAVYACRDGAPGIVLLSEFSCCARVLNGALRVNPWHTDEVASALERACTMSTAERLARRDRDLQFLLQTTASAWAERFCADLLRSTERPDEAWTPIGFGLAGFRRVGWGSTFRGLDTTEVLAAYRRARRRAIFLDWGGTLVPIIEQGKRSHALSDYYYHDLPTSLVHCLQELASDPSNLLMIISGQERSRMDQVFHAITGASLAAEHGFHFKLGSFPGVRRVGTLGWQQLMPDFDLSWKETILAILDAYTTRTNGAEIQDKGSSLVWKFDDVDPEFASMQVKELHQHLAQVLATDGRSSSPAQTLSLRPPPLPPPLSLSLPSHPPFLPPFPPPHLPSSSSSARLPAFASCRCSTSGRSSSWLWARDTLRSGRVASTRASYWITSWSSCTPTRAASTLCSAWATTLPTSTCSPHCRRATPTQAARP